MLEFSISKRSGKARTGRITTAHGEFQTPAFMPVGTQGTVKAVLPEQLRATGTEILLANTYHLYLRPGIEVIRKFDGLHRFMNWDDPILTDSGGFQVFSLSQLRQLTEEGIRFQSHIDGSYHWLTPEKSVEVQAVLGSDIMMALDECPPGQSSFDAVSESLELTTRWLERCVKTPRRDYQSLFGIVQGGMYPELRRRSLEQVAQFDLPGYALGGFSVGEEKQITRSVLAEIAPEMPDEKPRYLMGVGPPEDILFGIGVGIDMFDCVFPTRCGRNGVLFTWNGRLHIRREEYRLDEKPVEEGCGCYTCRNYSKAYLRHLDKAREINASVLCTIHNLFYYQQLMKKAREEIRSDNWCSFYEETLTRISSSDTHKTSC